jgi:hypothetical protein
MLFWARWVSCAAARHQYKTHELGPLEESDCLTVGTLDSVLFHSEGSEGRSASEVLARCQLVQNTTSLLLIARVRLAQLCRKIVWSSALVASLDLVLCQLQAVARANLLDMAGWSFV